MFSFLFHFHFARTRTQTFSSTRSLVSMIDFSYRISFLQLPCSMFRGFNHTPFFTEHLIRLCMADIRYTNTILRKGTTNLWNITVDSSPFAALDFPSVQFAKIRNTPICPFKLDFVLSLMRRQNRLDSLQLFETTTTNAKSILNWTGQSFWIIRDFCPVQNFYFVQAFCHRWTL